MMKKLLSVATLKSPTSKFLKNIQKLLVNMGREGLQTILQVTFLVSKFCQNQTNIKIYSPSRSQQGR